MRLLLIMLPLLFASQSVLACSVCFTANENTLLAYYGTTVLLSLLPMLMLGGLGFGLYRLAVRANRNQTDSNPADPASHL